MEIYIWICIGLWFAFSVGVILWCFAIEPAIKYVKIRRLERRKAEQEYERYLQNLSAIRYWYDEKDFTRR